MENLVLFMSKTALQLTDGLNRTVRKECHGRKYEKAVGIAEKTK